MATTAGSARRARHPRILFFALGPKSFLATPARHPRSVVPHAKSGPPSSVARHPGRHSAKPWRPPPAWRGPRFSVLHCAPPCLRRHPDSARRLAGYLSAAPQTPGRDATHSHPVSREAGHDAAGCLSSPLRVLVQPPRQRSDPPALLHMLSSGHCRRAFRPGRGPVRSSTRIGALRGALYAGGRVRQAWRQPSRADSRR